MTNPVYGRCPVCGDALNVTPFHGPYRVGTFRGRFPLQPDAQPASGRPVPLEELLPGCGRVASPAKDLDSLYTALGNCLSGTNRALAAKDDAGSSMERRRQVSGRLAASDVTCGRAVPLVQGWRS